MAKEVIKTVELSREALAEIRTDFQKQTHATKIIQELLNHMLDEAYDREVSTWDSVAKLAGFPGGMEEASLAGQFVSVDYVRGVIEVTGSQN